MALFEAENTILKAKKSSQKKIDRISNKLAFLRCLFFVKSEIILKDYNGSSPDKSLTSAYT